jgi:hypothetical protein
MALAEILTFKVAPAIAKSILRFWLQDREWAEDVTSGFVDIISAKAKGDLPLRQSGKRQFEAIGEQVAMELLSVFDYEGRGLDENSKNAIALAVSDTLANTPISPALIAAQNLDPAILANYLIESNRNAVSHFSKSEEMLYNRIVRESSKYIIDIASQLPGFVEQTFAEVLRRTAEIEGKVNAVLAELRRYREISFQANPASRVALFEQQYRESVARSLDRLELFGVDVAGPNKRYQLSVAYVTLTLKKSLMSYSTRQEINVVDQLLPKQVVTDVLSVDQVLMSSRQFLVRGLAGSGKTTLLQWIAVNSARQSFQGQISTWNDSIPFFIRLREFSDQPLPDLHSWVKLVAPSLGSEVPDGWVGKQLRSGRAIVLIDGVDEVPEVARRGVRDWIADLVWTYPKSRFVVTSRPSAVDIGWLEREGFDELELQPMELGDIDAFIDHWHDAIRDELHLEIDRLELPKHAKLLKSEIHKKRSLRSLATTPLLCAMLCALHRDRNRQIPSDRIELYEACCQMLLERRDVERGIRIATLPHLSYRQKKHLLQDIAYYMLKNGWSEVEKQRVEVRIASRLKSMEFGNKYIVSGDVLRLLLERSALLREPTKGQVDFAHRTFQDYFAAQAAVDEGDIGLLISNAHDDQWREVVILAAGLGSSQQREEIIRGLIDRGDRDQLQRYQIHLLAVACLETPIELTQALRNAVQQRLAKIIPPVSIADAKALSAAGDLAVPYLNRRHEYHAPVAAACIRALALIGTTHSLEALATYSKDDRLSVVDELRRAWDFFEPQEFVNRVFSVRKQVMLRKTAIRDVKALKGLISCVKLDLSGSDIDSVVEIADLPLLSSLDLSYCAVVDISPLSRLVSLVALILQGCRVFDLSALSELKNLKALNVGECPVEDMSPLQDLVQLVYLELNDTRVADIFSLHKLTQLRRLDLSGAPVSDIAPLSRMKHLQHLKLRDCPVKDISSLGGLNNLASLDLGGCPIEELSPIAGKHRLRILSISKSKVKDITVLSTLNGLESLDVSDCDYLLDLRPLASLPRLMNIDIRGISGDALLPDSFHNKHISITR